jgi:hypothetical protein
MIFMTSSSWLYTEDLYLTCLKLNMHWVCSLLDILLKSLEQFYCLFCAPCSFSPIPEDKLELDCPYAGL